MCSTQRYEAYTIFCCVNFPKTKELCITLMTPCDNLKLIKRDVIYTGAYDCVGGGGGGLHT